MAERVVSRQLDKVLVEQNHCHGLHADSASCYLAANPISEIDAHAFGKLGTAGEGGGQRTVVNAVRLRGPYTFFASSNVYQSSSAAEMACVTLGAAISSSAWAEGPNAQRSAIFAATRYTLAKR
jgi:hypothetical protein